MMMMVSAAFFSFSPNTIGPVVLPAQRRMMVAFACAPSSLPTEAEAKAVEQAFLDAEMPLLSTSSSAADLDLVRAAYPTLAEMSDEEMRDAITAYVSTPPKPLDVFFKTPIGPTLLLNLALLASGASYCDLPWADSSSKACVELAERLGS